MVHGGAGPVPRKGVDERAYGDALERALDAAARKLRRGALDAVQAAVEVLEDDPLFNAGRGSVPTADGAIEMDAALMCGRTRRAGAVAAVQRARHPVRVARAVMDRTPHVLLTAADHFAEEAGLELMDPAWFARRHRETPGTVGAVALDSTSALAAATSTGGRRGQLAGRVGDSALVGAGTYADGACAVSMTGDGEPIVRAVAAHEISALIRLAGMTLDEACERALAEVTSLGGAAGLIALDRDGHVATPFTTGLMHRGWKIGDAALHTATLP